MMASAQVVETSVNTNNSPSQDYTTNPDDHSNHNIDSPGFKPFTVIRIIYMIMTAYKQNQNGYFKLSLKFTVVSISHEIDIIDVRSSYDHGLSIQ